MAGLQSGEGRMMIHLVVLAQYVNVTDTRTDSHDAIANAALTHCVRRQKSNSMGFENTTSILFIRLRVCEIVAVLRNLAPALVYDVIDSSYDGVMFRVSGDDGFA